MVWHRCRSTKVTRKFSYLKNSSEETCGVMKVIQIGFCYEGFIMEKKYSLSLRFNYGKKVFVFAAHFFNM